jgi:hypothetical protein
VSEQPQEETAETPQQGVTVQVENHQVVETLQRKFAMLTAQLVYENAMLESALTNARGEIGELRARNEALAQALNAA